MIFKPLSPNSFIIYFGNSIDEKISQKVIDTYEAILRQKVDFIIDIIPSYTSIVIIFDILKSDFDTLKGKIQELKIKSNKKEKSEIINIDVYYGKEVAFDLQNIARNKNFSVEEIINIHTSKIYKVFAIGFLPAFAYMGNVSKSIASVRLKSPRKSVPKGSVGIADSQTAIYPQASPGGWNIIGRSAFKCFDKNLETLSPFRVGCRVKFNSISKEEFLAQGGQI